MQKRLSVHIVSRISFQSHLFWIMHAQLRGIETHSLVGSFAMWPSVRCGAIFPSFDVLQLGCCAIVVLSSLAPPAFCLVPVRFGEYARWLLSRCGVSHCIVLPFCCVRTFVLCRTAVQLRWLTNQFANNPHKPTNEQTDEHSNNRSNTHAQTYANRQTTKQTNTQPANESNKQNNTQTKNTHKNK